MSDKTPTIVPWGDAALEAGARVIRRLLDDNPCSGSDLHDAAYLALHRLEAEAKRAEAAERRVAEMEAQLATATKDAEAHYGWYENECSATQYEQQRAEAAEAERDRLKAECERLERLRHEEMLADGVTAHERAEENARLRAVVDAAGPVWESIKGWRSSYPDRSAATWSERATFGVSVPARTVYAITDALAALDAPEPKA